MSASLPLMLLLAAPAQANDEHILSSVNGIVIRPDTFVVDTRLSEPPVENFFEVWVDPASVATTIKPSSPPQLPDGPKGKATTGPSFPPTGDLILLNKTMSKAKVTISDVDLGLVHPLHEAVLRDVKSGCYDVTWLLADDYSWTESLCTVMQAGTSFPGGPTAAVYLEEGHPGRTEPEWRYGPPDRDKDGVADADDECPDEVGSQRAFGCPDGDDDRVPDYRDDCPEEQANKRADAKRSDGCPARVFVSLDAIVITEKIFFQTGKSRIKRESHGLLDEIAGILADHPEIKRVEIAGHTDSKGKDDFNLRLSDDRSKAVLTYLTDAGIDAARLTAKGYGETTPIGDNQTDEGRAMNRRVEFRILEQERRVVEVKRPAAERADAPGAAGEATEPTEGVALPKDDSSEEQEGAALPKGE